MTASSERPKAGAERCNERSLVDDHFAGVISPASERRMRDHLVDCGRCRARYQRHLVLAKLDPSAPSAEDRIARGLGLGIGRRRPALVVPLAVTALAIAAALVLFLRPAPRGDLGDSTFVPRGSVSSVPSPASAIDVYRVGTSPERALAVTSSLKHHDELAFAYRNADAKTHLMIFGTDERGRVYWFHPAWTDPSESPTAIPIASDGATHELREAIRHGLEGQRLEIHGVFVDRPITVQEAETAARQRGPTNRGPVVIAGAVDHVTTFVTSR